jgi:hypothetical protein
MKLKIFYRSSRSNPSHNGRKKRYIEGGNGEIKGREKAEKRVEQLEFFLEKMGRGDYRYLGTAFLQRQ